jgi:hypothetical protein
MMYYKGARQNESQISLKPSLEFWNTQLLIHGTYERRDSQLNNFHN